MILRSNRWIGPAAWPTCQGWLSSMHFRCPSCSNNFDDIPLLRRTSPTASHWLRCLGLNSQAPQSSLELPPFVILSGRILQINTGILYLHPGHPFVSGHGQRRRCRGALNSNKSTGKGNSRRVVTDSNHLMMTRWACFNLFISGHDPVAPRVAWLDLLDPSHSLELGLDAPKASSGENGSLHRHQILLKFYYIIT